MLRTLFGFDWRKSKAHLLLLTKFLSPKTVDDFAQSDLWKAALGEDPKQVVKRFLNEGMLSQADVSARLDYRFKATELKEMLKERALAMSGRKSDLIERLIQADPEAMKRAVSGLSVLLCSERGREIAEQYVVSEKAKRRELEQRVMEHLRQRRFRQASEAVASYEAEQVFERGMGIDWKHYNPARDIEMLKTIFDSKPKILRSLNDSQLDTLRIAAGMMCLLGTTSQGEEWSPRHLQTGLAIDGDAAARMFEFYAAHQANLAEYKASGVVEQVEIVASSDSCDACKKMAGKRYKLDDVPELPYEYCTHDKGCRCTLQTIIK
jgi:hypothetical protein